MTYDADARERKAQLYLQHPEESPELIGVLDYLIHPPGRLSRTSSWVAFRDKTLLPMIRHRPDDPNLLPEAGRGHSGLESRRPTGRPLLESGGSVS